MRGQTGSDETNMDREGILNLPRVFGLEQAQNPRKSQKLEEILVELYTGLRPSLVGYAYHVAGSSGDCEDLVQMAFLKLFDELKRNAEILNIRSWLYRVVHNLAIDQARRKGSHEAALAGWLADRSHSDRVSSSEDEIIRQQQVANFLGILNQRERQCLMLRSEGLSYHEIGEVVGISHKSVSVYLARGLKKVRSAA